MAKDDGGKSKRKLERLEARAAGEIPAPHEDYATFIATANIVLSHRLNQIPNFGKVSENESERVRRGFFIYSELLQKLHEVQAFEDELAEARATEGDS